MASFSEKNITDRFQGIEYFWDSVKNQSQNRHEVALALIHWMLVGKGFRCVGRDNQFPTAAGGSRVGSERLPENWNDRSAGFYSLLYIHPHQPSNMYLIKLIPAAGIDDSVICGQILVSSVADDVISFELESNKYVPQDWKSVASPSNFSEFKCFVEFVDKEIIATMKPKQSAQGGSSSAGARQAGQQPSSAHFIGQAQAPPPSRPIPFVPDIGPPLREFIPPGGGRGNPFALGSRDLDPFGGMGGNMMGPGHFNPGGLPASGMFRYDPIVPPEFGPPGGPGQRLPFRGDPLGVGSTFPGRGNPLGSSGGVGMPPGSGMRLPAPLHPGEPDPDHELPPRPPGPGDDMSNMFM